MLGCLTETLIAYLYHHNSGNFRSRHFAAGGYEPVAEGELSMLAVAVAPRSFLTLPIALPSPVARAQCRHVLARVR